MCVHAAAHASPADSLRREFPRLHPSATPQKADIVEFQSTELPARSRDSYYHPGFIAIPAALVATGVYGVYSEGFAKMDQSIKDGMDDLRKDRYLTFDDYLQYAPLTAYLGLDYLGVKARNPLRERMVTGLTAYAAMAVMVQVPKNLITEVRPDGRGDNSFPSGHTATAFLGAELVREEYGALAGITAYSWATGIGFMRMYNGRHWLKDVLAGAGVGIISARVGYWLLPCWRKLFRWDRNKNTPVTAIAPAYGYTPQTGHSLSLSVGISL